MAGTDVPIAHSVVRYCKPSSLSEGAPSAASFARKPAHAGLSVNDIDGTEDAKAEATAAQGLMSPWLKMSPNGRLAVLPVKSIFDIDSAPPLTVYREPQIDRDNAKPPNPRHCEIGNVPSEDDLQAGRTSVLLALAAAVTAHWSLGEL